MIREAKVTKQPDENFMLVLREVEGANKRQFGFTATGPSTVTLSNGEKITLNSAWFDLIGDMHVRFVLDSEHSMKNLTAEEFGTYKLTPEQATVIAVNNIKTRYGEPQSTPWMGNVMAVAGRSPDLDSSYFLDTAFWDNLLLKHPEGVVVGVPKRGGLIYVPASNTHAVSTMERGIHYLYTSSENLRVSSALYMYKSNLWTVFRDPMSIR